MRTQLARKLIEQEIIKKDTIITAKVITKGICDEGIEVFKDLRVKRIDKTFFSCTDQKSIEKFMVPFEDVVLIEGMDTKRFAMAYELKEDGSKMELGKKRGRKPKGENLSV